MRKVIIDTDPGIGAIGADIDDGLAIVMAANSPELEILGLTITYGNVPLDQGTINALRLLEVMERTDIPVFKGADRPLVGDMAFVRETFAEIVERAGWKEPVPVSASDTLKPQPKDAARFIIDQVRANPHQVTVICIGPLTNLALAIRLDPGVPNLIRETVIMGGGWTQPLDCMTPVAEFNMFCDPEAAKIVFHSGMRLYMTGYEMSTRTVLRREHLQTLRQLDTRVSRYIVGLADPWLAFMKAAYGLDGCYLPDPQAIALAVDRSIFTLEEMYVDIETKGELTRGMTVADRNRALRRCAYEPNTHVCVDIDVDRFMNFFLERVH